MYFRLDTLTCIILGRVYIARKEDRMDHTTGGGGIGVGVARIEEIQWMVEELLQKKNDTTTQRTESVVSFSCALFVCMDYLQQQQEGKPHLPSLLGADQSSMTYVRTYELYTRHDGCC